MERLQGKCVSLETENSSTKEQLASLIGSVEVLTTERDDLQDVKNKNEADMKKKLEVSHNILCGPMHVHPHTKSVNFRVHKMIKRRKSKRL